MNKRLYNSIVRGISESLQKSLYEGLFDDIDDILSNDDIDSSQLMDDYLKKVILETLCTIDAYLESLKSLSPLEFLIYA